MQQIMVTPVPGSIQPVSLADQWQEADDDTAQQVEEYTADDKHLGRRGIRYRYMVLFVLFCACLAGIGVTAMSGYVLFRYLPH